MCRSRHLVLASLVAVLLVGFMMARAVAEEARKETGSISGTVLGTDGKPAVGAEVRLVKPVDRGQRGAQAGATTAPSDRRNRAERPKPVATATTDNAGKFTMSDVPAGSYAVMARQKGLGGARGVVEVKAGQTATVELKLKERKPAAK